MQLEFVKSQEFFQKDLSIESWGLFKEQNFYPLILKKMQDFYCNSSLKNKICLKNFIPQEQRACAVLGDGIYKQLYEKKEFNGFLEYTKMLSCDSSLQNDEGQEDGLFLEVESEVCSFLCFIADFILWNYGARELRECDLFLEVIFITRDEMREANLQYMQKDYATDVLSFPLEIQENIGLQCLGSIVINMYEVCNKARFYNHNIYAEIALLFTHAMLHILGFDHESDAGEHRKSEYEILHFLSLPSSLIERAYNA